MRSSGGEVRFARLSFGVVPATRLRQGFAGVMTVGRRSFSEGAKQGPIRRDADVTEDVRCLRLRRINKGRWLWVPAFAGTTITDAPGNAPALRFPRQTGDRRHRSWRRRRRRSARPI